MKRDWEGQVIISLIMKEYFKMYYLKSLPENKKPAWHQLAQERKDQISEELTKLFGSANNVIKVPYSK